MCRRGCVFSLAERGLNDNYWGCWCIVESD